MMASSQVEIASSSPLGCVLKDHNSRRDRRRDPNPKSQSNFQRNLKELVRDHFHSCISISPRASNTEPDENSHHQGGNFSCFGGSGGGNICNSSRGNSRHHRWAAQKAKEMVTTIESLSSSNDVSVSSLVQKWRGFEAEAKHCQATTAATTTTTNSNNNNDVNVNVNTNVSKANSGVSTCESTVTTATVKDAGERERVEEREMEEEGVAVSSLSTDGGERERIRVADIVRKWACDEGASGNQDQQQQQQQPPLAACLARLRIGMEPPGGGGEQRVVCSPKIRGRQAIADLYMKMERERYKEVELLGSRQPVSKFPQRGRIQSLLRLRFLRRGVSEQEQRQPPPPSRAVGGSSQCQTASAITSLRERFSNTPPQDSTDVRNARRDTSNSNQDTESTSTSKQPLEQASCQEDLTIVTSHTKTMSNYEGVDTISTSNEEPEQPINANNEESNTESQLHSSEEALAQQNSLTQVIEVHQEEIPCSEVIWQEIRYEDVNLETQDAGVETATSYNGWEGEEEEMISEDQFLGTNLEWISDIARPRSYWEDLRQSWYQEVFNTRSQDEEIRQLLERGSVSAVLASDFRDRMDQLVMSSVQQAMHSSANEEEEEERSMRSFLEQHNHNRPSFNHHSEEVQVEEHEDEHIEDVGQVEQNAEEDEQENEGEEVSFSMHQYHDASDYYDQNSSSSQFDHDGSDDLDHAASTSLTQPSPVPSYDCDTQGGSSFKKSSTEMEIINDLRSHMEQLYREMSELRKSVTGCMDMQMKLQQSIREEVSAAISHTVRVKGKDSNRRQPKKGSCCICYEKKVDSLLYRCGHMCTCFKCAHELQWSSGKCPICRAHIIDVVRAYPDTELD